MEIERSEKATILKLEKHKEQQTLVGVLLIYTCLHVNCNSAKPLVLA